jgi:hypothetical protein
MIPDAMCIKNQTNTNLLTTIDFPSFTTVLFTALHNAISAGLSDALPVLGVIVIEIQTDKLEFN